MERSHLSNGRFLHNLQQWSLSGGVSYSAGDGDEHYGVAVVPPGGSLYQDVAVPQTRRYTLHLAVKTGVASITIRDGDGNSVLSTTAPGSAGVWTETSIVLGLAPGTTYRLTISNAGLSSISIDDVWLWWVPYTRQALAETVARKLGALATDASLTTTASGAQTEGGYTDAVSAGLRALGAIDPETDLPDVRGLDASNLGAALDAIEREVLERLYRHYSRLVDTSIGPRRQSLSQIRAAVGKLIGISEGVAAGVPGKIISRTLRRKADDYEFS